MPAQANAAFIVLAVNNHDALVKALELFLAGRDIIVKQSVNDWKHTYKLNQQSVNRIEAALASAKQE